MRLIFLVAFLLNICQSAAHAEQRIALVIGGSAFVGSTRIEIAATNADKMAFALRRLGFDVTELIDAPLGDTLLAIENFRMRLMQDGTVGIFYHSGYAAQFDGSNFILPADFGTPVGSAKPAGGGAAGVILDQLLESQVSNGLKIVLLDPVAPPANLLGQLQPGFAGIRPVDGTIVMVSAEPEGSDSHR